MKLTFSIVSRFLNIDIPYMNQWIEHYVSIGVTYFHLYYISSNSGSNSDLNDDEIYRWVDKLKTVDHVIQRVNLDQQQVGVDSNHVFVLFPPTPKITQDYILHFDSDEYLYINERYNSQLENFIQSQSPKDTVFRFKWIMCPAGNKPFYSNVNTILQDHTLPKYILYSHKSMGKTSNVRFTLNPHEFATTTTTLHPKTVNDCFLIHFCYRGLYDVYYKCFFQNLITQSENDTLTKIPFTDPQVEEMSLADIPSRVLVFLAEMNHSNIPLQAASGRYLPADFQFHGIQSFVDPDVFNQPFLFSDRHRTLFCNRVKFLLSLHLFRDLVITDHQSFKGSILKHCRQQRHILVPLPPPR